MQRVGTTTGGNALVEMTNADFETLDLMMGIVHRVKEAVPPVQRNAAPLPLATKATIKPAPKKAPVATAPTGKRICINPKCGKAFVPVRVDQKCCSVACRAQIHTPKKKPQPATPPPVAQPVAPVAKPDRLNLIRERAAVVGPEARDA